MNRICSSISVPCIAIMLSVSGLAAVSLAAEAPSAPAQAAEPNLAVVATIGDYSITRDELIQKLLQEMRPQEEEFYAEPKPVTARSVLNTMLGEKAMSMEGRKLGYLQDDSIQTAVTQFEQQQIVRRLLQTELGDKVTVTEEEIDRVMKANPKATREQVKAYVQRAKAMRLMDLFFQQIAQKRHLKKETENIAKAAAIHERLLTKPAVPRGPTEYWIKNSQLKTDLSDEEKGLVLATFDGGQFTLKDWFVTICNMAPPRRPKDLGTPKGAEKLLDMALRGPVLAVEAKSRGYDRDPQLRSDLRRLEDQRLLYKMQEVAMKEVKEPTPEQVKAAYDKDPNAYATNAILKADQIWCPDEATARKVREMLDGGADFQTVKKEHSLQKNVPEYTLSPSSEGIFWADLGKGEPNQVLGPVKGFYGRGVKWRVVKVIEKTPAKPREFSDQLANSIKWSVYGRERRQALADYEKTLLEKYPHEIFFDRIKDIDPMEVALAQKDQGATGSNR